jgi:hypothetical protein
MRQAGQEVGPDVLRQVERLARRVGREKGDAGLKVLGIRVRVHDLRAAAGRGRAAPEDAVRPAAERVRADRVGEGELVARIKVVLVIARVAAGLGEAGVHEALARAGDVRDDAVEHAPPRLVLVETLVDEVAQEASALGDAERVGVAHRGPAVRRERIGNPVRRAGLVAEEGDHVARRGEAEAQDLGVPGGVDELVDRAGVVAGRARDLHPGRAQVLEGQVGRPRARIPFPGADGQGRSRGVEIRGRVGQIGGRRVLEVVEDELVAARAGHARERRHGQPEDVFAVARSPCQPLHTTV